MANRIHIIEPQWNPMVEEQAMGRALRIGQKRQVTVIRYVMQDTIEQVVPFLLPILFVTTTRFRAMSPFSDRRVLSSLLFPI